MMREPCHRPDDFDDNGLLKAPVLFWVGLVMLARAWWLAGLAIASEHGGYWFVRFYPDVALQWLGLLTGLSALVMLFCYPVRSQFPGLVRVVFLLMLATALAAAVCDGLVLARQLLEEQDAGCWLLLCMDVACLSMLLPDRRLRAVFLSDGLCVYVNK
ncbi:DUF2919 family protein [Salmonella enterica]|nr:DUF2919 family protein [Salmonella enterica]EJE2083208.1 DUF2919 family protein [Salmonella enterica]